MTTHTITLARHTAQVVGLMGLVGVLVLGTWDSYGTEQLLLRHGPEWEGLAIDATFHNVPNDEGVTVLADTDGLVPVPPEACIRPSRCATITFRGVQDTYSASAAICPTWCWITPRCPVPTAPPLPARMPRPLPRCRTCGTVL